MIELHKSKEIIISISSSNNVLILNDRNGKEVLARIDCIFKNPTEIVDLNDELRELKRTNDALMKELKKSVEQHKNRSLR